RPPGRFPMNRLAAIALFALLAVGSACSKPASGPAHSGEKPLFYRHPMQPDITSPVPAKDDMGMDYVAVYADPETAAAGTPPAVAPALSEASLTLGGVAVVPVARESIARSVRLPGVVAADEARRTEVVARTGERVSRGQTLARLFSPELVAGEEEYLRARESADRFAGSAIPEVARGGAELAAAARRRLSLLGLSDETIARIERSGTSERTLAIVAPGSGWVTRLGAVRGARVEAGTMLFEISD